MGATAAERNISEDLSREIDESVEEVISELGTGKKIAPEVMDDDNENESEDNDISEDADAEDISSEENISDDEGSDDDDKDAVTDDLIERAVVSKHFTMAEAKAFKSAALLKSMCDKLDVKQADENGADGDAETSEAEPDPLAAIPDLDPEDYDENIIAGFKALKDIVRQQSEEISKLRVDGAKNAVQGFFDSKVLGLSKEFTEALKEDPKKQSALRKQHDVLVAGYEATGEKVSQDDIFDQAVSIVMGDVKTTITEKKLRDRKSQHINRAGGTKTKVSADPLDEVADAVDRKYFGKK